MIATVKKLWKNTAIRLSVIFALVFGLLAFALVAYLVGSTVKVLRSQFEMSINQEIDQLRAVYTEGGLNNLVRAMERRASAPGANIYIISDASGRILAGNVRDLEKGVLKSVGWTGRPFKYTRFSGSEEDDFDAIARIVVLPNGMRVLIGRDIGERRAFQEVVSRSLTLALGLMVLFGVLTWLLVGRRAMKRLELLSKSTDRILAGDKDERLPVNKGNDEFDRLSGRLNQMLDRIDHLDQGLKQVSDNIAHDLKTPLTRLRNKAETGLLAEPEKAHETFEELVQECDNLIKTFNALLMISRVESGSTAAQMSRVNLSAITEDIVELYEPVAEEEAFQLAATVEKGLEINGNRELLSQALSNLIDNAVKYGTPEGEGNLNIEVGLGAGPDGLRLTVSDNGPGIAPKDREQALERFARLEASRNKPGNGLGLSLVRAVTRLHGGTVTLEDNEPGLRVALHFPKTAMPKNKPEMKPAPMAETNPLAAT